MDGAAVMDKIFITNMCTDDNKGDLSIMENTVKILRNIYPSSQIVIQNADYSQEDIDLFRINRFSNKLSDRYHGSFFPKVYSRREENPIKPMVRLVANFIFSLWTLVVASLTGLFSRNLSFFVPRRHRLAWRDLYECDLVVVKGGSYIYSYGGMKQILFTYRMLYTLILAVWLGKKIILFGHSIGPIKGRLMMGLAKTVLQRVDRILLREKLSYDYVSQILQLEESKLGLIPDLAFLANLPVVASSEEIVKKIALEEGISGLRAKDVLIGVTARDWWFPGKKNPQRLRENYIEALLEAIDFVKYQFQATVLFIPHCLEDLEFVDEVVARLQDKTNVFILRGDYAPNELRRILSSLKLLIGTRIHSTIFALTSGVPVVAIAYEIHKGYGILEMAGQKDFVLDISKLRQKELLSRIDVAMNRHKELESQIKAKVAALSRELEEKAGDYFHHIH